MINVCDLKRQYELYASEYENKVLEILRSGWYILGREESSFEKEFANYIGTKHCVGVASGLDALWIAFRLLKIKDGDEVIVCASAYIACVMGITINGATPVFVEPDQYDNIDAEKIEAAITPKTRAILAVHLYGQVCDMDKIMKIADQYKLLIVEDCAQSHGSLWNEKRVGGFGVVGCFSFYPTKGCGAFGDAGAIVTDDDDLAESFRTFRNYGSREKYKNEVVGANSRLDELQAGVLRVKLKHLEEINQERRKLAERYLSKIHNSDIQLPKVREKSVSTWHQFVIHTGKRNELKEYLWMRGIDSSIHYPIPPHLSDAYRYLGYNKGDFPVAEKFAEEVLSIPIYNGMTENEQEYVIKALNEFECKDFMN